MKKFLSLLLVSFLLLPFSILHAADTAAKKWTFLIFLNGNNNLDSMGDLNIRQMEQIGSNDDVNIVVQWASYKTHKVLRMLIQKSDDPSKVTSPVLEDLGAVDMGNYHSLQNFIEWGVKNFPADHYFINVWNHGSGWHYANKKQFVRTLKPYDISWDDFTGNSITTEQLGIVMASAAKTIGHKVDIYGSDACLMAMAEVADQMADSVDVFVGSQETEPGTGWPYADLLGRWEALKDMSSSEVAKVLVDAYVKAYQGGVYGYSDVTFSAFDLSKLPAFDLAMAYFTMQVEMLSAEDKKLLLAAIDNTQKFAFDDYVDLGDFLKKIANIKAIDPKVISDLQEAIHNVVIANADTEGYANATGLSIWLPKDKDSYEYYAIRYKGLKFNGATHWQDALLQLLM